MADNESLAPRANLFGGFQVKEYLDIVRRRRWWIVFTTVAVTLLAGVVAWRLPNTWRAETVILIDPPKISGHYVIQPETTPMADRIALIREQVLAPSQLKKLIDTMGLYPEYKGHLGDQEIIQKMADNISVDVVEPLGRRINAFSLAYFGKNPAGVAQVANQLAAMFIEENLKDREQESYGTAEFLGDELGKIKKQLEDKEGEIQQIKSRYIMDLPESKQYHIEALTSLRTQLQAAQDRVNAARQEKVYLHSVATTSAPTIDLDASGGGSPYQVEIQKLEAELGELQTRYGPNYPDVRKVQNKLSDLRAKEAKVQQNSGGVPATAASNPQPAGNPVIQSRLGQLDEEIRQQTRVMQQLQEQINFRVSRLEQGPVFEAKIAGMMRDYDTLRAHYNQLLDKKLSADTTSALETRQKGERFVILDPARVPEKPYGPKRLLIALAGLLGGFCGGLGLALVAEMTDESVRSEREAGGILGAPALAGIPLILSKHDIFRRRLRLLATLSVTIICSIGAGFAVVFVSGRWM